MQNACAFRAFCTRCGGGLRRAISVRAVNASLTAKGVLLGLLAGVMSGLFGIGGGAVLVPLLVLWLALQQHRAHATSLAAIIVSLQMLLGLTPQEGTLTLTGAAAVAAYVVLGVSTAVVGSVRHAKNGYTDWRLGVVLGAGGVVGAWLGASLALQLDADLLQRLFAIFLLLTGLQLLWSTRSRSVEPVLPEIP